ncbi:hypothetical protein BBBOND_0403210 [Babesia bigemina]|uniref:Uncharacterized protein n=1 Tax=Babesia bigemina TaxID=5866 RepID=A0A061DBD2_BABBI|nr:hypothetical protein BBBOND_0403210 [Babesia bigemina]CDR97833.1 hypothetical protein BBBOND_0403210 [Babesia bigemina]|eukprot:XP_012770019.1 hypothetical protein BBBOND_0403210 [Babesia bigemina]
MADIDAINVDSFDGGLLKQVIIKNCSWYATESMLTRRVRQSASPSISKIRAAPLAIHLITNFLPVNP